MDLITLVLLDITIAFTLISYVPGKCLSCFNWGLIAGTSALTIVSIFWTKRLLDAIYYDTGEWIEVYKKIE